MGDSICGQYRHVAPLRLHKEQNKSFVLRIDAQTMAAVEKWASQKTERQINVDGYPL